jgi:hypothetical protein
MSMDGAALAAAISFAVQIAAGVAPMKWPQHAWLAGWIFWGSCLFALACCGWWGIENRDWLMATIKPIHIGWFAVALLVAALIWQSRQSASSSTTSINSPSTAGTKDEKISGDRLRNAQILINGSIAPAETAMESLLDKILQAVRGGSNNQLKALSENVRRGTKDLLQNQFARVTRISQGFDSVTDKELQDILGWYWNEYRLQRLTIKAAIDSGIDIARTTEFRDWLAADKAFVVALKQYVAAPENQSLGSTMKSHGWDDSIAKALNEHIK